MVEKDIGNKDKDHKWFGDEGRYINVDTVQCLIWTGKSHCFRDMFCYIYFGEVNIKDS